MHYPEGGELSEIPKWSNHVGYATPGQDQLTQFVHTKYAVDDCVQHII